MSNSHSNTSSPSLNITRRMQRKMKYDDYIVNGNRIIRLDNGKTSLEFTFRSPGVLQMAEFHKINPIGSDEVLGKPDKLAMCAFHYVLRKLRKDNIVTPNTRIFCRIDPLTPFDMPIDETELAYNKYIKIYEKLGFSVEEREYVIDNDDMDIKVIMAGTVNDILKQSKKWCTFMDTTQRSHLPHGGKSQKTRRRR
jgi:hypothetical protein